MSLTDIDAKTAAMGVMGSLMAYMFYGRIEDASNIQALQQAEIQAKSERVDWWGKWNDKIKDDQDKMFKMADYMIEQEKEKAALAKEIQRVELENERQWKEYYKNNQ